MPNIPYVPDLISERGKHLHWCKMRAFEYLDRERDDKFPFNENAIRENMRLAWTSFQSDMSKNQETSSHRCLNIVLASMYMNSPKSLRSFIEGFN